MTYKIDNPIGTPTVTVRDRGMALAIFSPSSSRVARNSVDFRRMCWWEVEDKVKRVNSLRVQYWLDDYYRQECNT